MGTTGLRTQRCLGVVFVLAWAIRLGAAQANATLQALERDQGLIQSAVTEGDLAGAWLRSVSSLYSWKNFPDFPFIVKKIEESYAWLPKERVRQEFEGRRALVSQSPDCIAWLHLAVLGITLEDFPAASACFQEALKDEGLNQNPFVHAFHGRSLLYQGQVESATAAYELAVRTAEIDPATRFRVRHLFLSDLLDAGRLNLILKYASECLDSEYALERAWALENWIYYLWSQGAAEELGSRVRELQVLFPTLTVRPELPFEQDRYERAQTLLREVEQALAGDPVMLMAMDEEATTIDFANGDFQRALDRLEPWARRFPISDYGTWTDQQTREVGIWVNYVRAAALARMERLEEAEGEFRKILQHVPFAEFSGRVVDVYGWLGFTLKGQGRLEQARDTLAIALTLDVSRADASITKGLPHDFSQERVRSGETSSQLRASIVKQYEELQASPETPNEGGN